MTTNAREPARADARTTPSAGRALALAAVAMACGCGIATAVEALGTMEAVCGALPLPREAALPLATALVYALIAAPAAAVCLALRLPPRDAGLVGAHTARSNVAGVALGACVIAAAAAVRGMLGAAPVGPAALAGVAGTLAVAAFAEEALFRGFLQARVERALAAHDIAGWAVAAGAVAVTAVAFAAFHLPRLLIGGLPPAAALAGSLPMLAGGLAFGTAARLSGDVYAAFWLHLALNLAALMLTA